MAGFTIGVGFILAQKMMGRLGHKAGTLEDATHSNMVGGVHTQEKPSDRWTGADGMAQAEVAPQARPSSLNFDLTMGGHSEGW